MIRVDSVWMATAPLDMRAGPDTVLMHVVRVFGAAHPHHAYVFANRRCNRMKILVHDGLGVWLAARRLNQGGFVWLRSVESTVQINTSQLGALTMGLPWQRLGDAGIIAVI
jgi:transposase